MGVVLDGVVPKLANFLDLAKKASLVLVGVVHEVSMVLDSVVLKPAAGTHELVVASVVLADVSHELVDVVHKLLKLATGVLLTVVMVLVVAIPASKYTFDMQICPSCSVCRVPSGLGCVLKYTLPWL